MPIQPSDNLNATVYAIAADIASFHMRWGINSTIPPLPTGRNLTDAADEAQLVHDFYSVIMNGKSKPAPPPAGTVGAV